MEQRDIEVCWDEANIRSATGHGVSKEACDALIHQLSFNPGDKIWRDCKNSQREMYGVKRYVAVVRGVRVRGVNSDRGVFICFALTYTGLNEQPKAIRVIAARPASNREPVLRKRPPKRFTREPFFWKLVRS